MIYTRKRRGDKLTSQRIGLRFKTISRRLMKLAKAMGVLEWLIKYFATKITSQNIPNGYVDNYRFMNNAFLSRRYIRREDKLNKTNISLFERCWADSSSLKDLESIAKNSSPSRWTITNNRWRLVEQFSKEYWHVFNKYQWTFGIDSSNRHGTILNKWNQYLQPGSDH